MTLITLINPLAKVMKQNLIPDTREVSNVNVDWIRAYDISIIYALFQDKAEHSRTVLQ